MARYRRHLLLILLISTTILLLLRSSAHIKYSRRWRHGHHNVGSRQTADTGGQRKISAPLREPQDLASFQPVQNTLNLSGKPSPFLPGKPKPHGAVYTKAVVLGRLSSENTTWLDEANLPSHISKFIYLTDHHQPQTPDLSTSPDLIPLPNPKGHESMVYLTYIIDHYTTLADITIFLHAHQYAWHNVDLLNHDALEMITRLSAERVTREGYMNLRCNWKPGCPEYLHPQTTLRDPEKQEETAVAAAWAALFPGEPLPHTLAGPCCAQFAVSRARVREIPLARFTRFRDWLAETPLDDYVSGRVFEYLWHRIFTGRDEFCPDMRLCYCDGYGVCFPDETGFDYWFELRYKRREAEKRLREWRDEVEEAGESGNRVTKKKNKKNKNKNKNKSESERVPAGDGDVVLQREMDEYAELLEDMRLRALEAGTDPRVRARVAGREWVDGDGY